MKRQLPTEKEARGKIRAIEKEFGIKYTKVQRKETVERLTGRGPSFK